MLSITGANSNVSLAAILCMVYPYNSLSVGPPLGKCYQQLTDREILAFLDWSQRQGNELVAFRSRISLISSLISSLLFASHPVGRSLRFSAGPPSKVLRRTRLGQGLIVLSA